MQKRNGVKSGRRILFVLLCVVEKCRNTVYKTGFKMKKMYWYGKLSDDDMFIPSCPHLHSIDEKYKLNVYTGEIYDIRAKRFVVGKKVDEAELKKLWKERRFFDYAIKMRRRYVEKYPHSVLPPIPFE